MGTKMTQERKARILAGLRRGLSRRAAAENTGVTKMTLWNHMQTDEEFRDAVVEAEESCIDEIENVLFEKAKGGDVRSIIHFLKCRRPEVWADVNRVQFAGAVAGYTKEDYENQLKEYDSVFEALAGSETPALVGEVGDVVDEEEEN